MGLLIVLRVTGQTTGMDVANEEKDKFSDITYSEKPTGIYNKFQMR